MWLDEDLPYLELRDRAFKVAEKRRDFKFFYDLYAHSPAMQAVSSEGGSLGEIGGSIIEVVKGAEETFGEDSVGDMQPLFVARFATYSCAIIPRMPPWSRPANSCYRPGRVQAASCRAACIASRVSRRAGSPCATTLTRPSGESSSAVSASCKELSASISGSPETMPGSAGSTGSGVTDNRLRAVMADEVSDELVRRLRQDDRRRGGRTAEIMPPTLSTAMRSAMRTASSMLWVTRTTVLRTCC